jgi:hypothetical protein
MSALSRRINIDFDAATTFIYDDTCIDPRAERSISNSRHRQFSSRPSTIVDFRGAY